MYSLNIKEFCSFSEGCFLGITRMSCQMQCVLFFSNFSHLYPFMFLLCDILVYFYGQFFSAPLKELRHGLFVLKNLA